MSAVEPQVRPRRGIVTTLLVLATLIGVVGCFAVWTARQLLETDTWTKTSSEMLEDPDIREAVSAFLVDALFSNVDVQGQLEGALPGRLKPLAGPAAGGLRQLAEEAAPRLLEQPKVQSLWEQANRAAHTRFLAVVNDETESLTTRGDEVYLDLGVVVRQLGTAVGIDIASRIPAGVAEIDIMRADQLTAVQDGADGLEKLAYILPLIALLLLALAVYLARGWRRVAVRSAGFVLIAVGLVVLVSRGIAGNFVVDALATTAAVEPAADSVWTIGTSLLSAAAVALIGYGAVIVIGAWLAGPGSLATSARGSIAPVLRERRVLYPILLAIVLLVIWWSPTEGTRRLLPSLLLIALLIAGAEALRRQTIAEFPDRDMSAFGEAWRARFDSILDRARNVRLPRRAAAVPEATPSEPPPAEQRISQLERLAELHRAGVIDDAELAREKERVLA